MISRQEVREALTGPVMSVSTPHCADSSIDEAGLRNFIDLGIDAGCKTIVITNGDSLFTAMTDQDVADVTKTIVEHVSGRAMVVAADRQWGTSKEIEFAKYARDVGADMLMVLPPDWACSCTPQTLVEHYTAVSKHIAVMVVTNLFIPRPDAFGLETLQRLCDGAEGVMAVKDDCCGQFARKMAGMVYDRMAVISGGQKQNHLDVHPYGCDGYFSTFVKFAPAVMKRYWQAITANDYVAARDVIRDYDMPFFDFAGRTTGGFDAAVHGALELFGVAQRWRPQPYYSLSDEEMEQLADLFKGLGLL